MTLSAQLDTSSSSPRPTKSRAIWMSDGERLQCRRLALRSQGVEEEEGLLLEQGSVSSTMIWRGWVVIEAARARWQRDTLGLRDSDSIVELSGSILVPVSLGDSQVTYSPWCSSVFVK